MSFSVEYRWPVDRLVDGVIFDEYALIAPKIDKWSLYHYYNSWGFGIRVRQPDLYPFRLQFGFHGLHGVNLIMTIAPEFK
jgi:outer membrane protein assembly factor BamA